jgi:protein-S-isoprenylcysteine O-methyltransferase Ste14
MPLNLTPSSITFSLSLLLSLYLSTLSMTSPNPQPETPHHNDSFARVVSPMSQLFRRGLLFALYAYAIVLVITFPTPPPLVCPSASHLPSYPYLFTWSLHSTACLSLIYVGALLRLSAYSGLGRNFTFVLAEPDRLITTGLYHNVQHPSYVGQLIVMGANLALLCQWDGALGCWIKGSSFEGWAWTERYIWGALAFLAVWGVRVRVRDEEAMLKGKFGKEWEEWHGRTKRFIPGIF